MKFLPSWPGLLFCGFAIFATAAVFYDAGIPYLSAILYTGGALGWFTNWARRFFDRPMYPLVIGVAVILSVIMLMVEEELILFLLVLAIPVMVLAHFLIDPIFRLRRQWWSGNFDQKDRSLLEATVLVMCLLTAPVLSRIVLWTQEEALLTYIDTLPFSQEDHSGGVRVYTMPFSPEGLTGGVRVGVYTIVHATRFPDGQAILFTSSCIEFCRENGGHGGWMYNPPRPTALPRAQRQFNPEPRHHAFGAWWKLPNHASYSIWGA
jgi:hypothetical protein